MLGAKQSLAEIGLRESDLDRAADLAENSYPNPTPITRERLCALLDDAFHGRRPSGWPTAREADDITGGTP